MTHHLHRRTVLLAATALLLGGCAGTDSDSAPTASGARSSAAAPLAPADPNAKVTLTWWTGQEAEAQATLKRIAAAFTAQHPNVTINVSSGASTTDDLLQKMTAGFAAGTYPDISYAYGSWASELGNSGRTLDISGNIADPAVGWSEFPEGSRVTATVGGKVIGMPSVVGNLALIYNKAVFDKAGVDYPTDAMTWDQFREVAKKLTDPAKNVYGTAYDVTGSEGTTWVMWPQLWQNGGDILSSDGRTAAFSSEAGVKAVSYWRDLAVTDKSVYLDQTGEKAGGLLQSGNVGMLIGGPWFLYDLHQAKTSYGVTFLPGTGADHQTVAGADLWVLFDHKDANRAYWSYAFTAFLTAAAQDEQWNIALGNLPLRSSEKSSAAFAQADRDLPGYAHFADNLANAKKPRPTVQGYVGLSKAFGEAVAKVLQGQGDPAAALAAAKAKADLALAGQ